MKTLSGLKRVHAILRRLDDDFCDPLELRADSALGVPGLLGVVRAGRVALANALGAGVLESAAWLGFLPGAGRDAAGRIAAPAVGGNLVVRREAGAGLCDCASGPAGGEAGIPESEIRAAFWTRSGRGGARKVVARLRNRPYAYVAQERISLSQAPSWRAGAQVRLAPRTLTMRVYAIATPNGYEVMPGGLARIAADGVVDIVSSQRGGGSKDVWVLGPGC
jgi:uncharacterized circularly permuted ATP-grasp superfamily protein